MGREAKVHKNLTRKQYTFVKNILEGKSATQSALAAYNTSNAQVASVIAHENLSKPSIKEALEDLLRSQGLSLSTITANIGDMASQKPTKVSGETVLKANIELLKLMGAYPDKKNTSVSFSFESKVRSMTDVEAKEEFKKSQRQNEKLMREIGMLE